MAPRIQRQVAQAPHRRSARHQAREKSGARDWQVSQRPSSIFGPAAQSNFAYVHKAGSRNEVIQQTRSKTEDEDELLQRLLGQKAFISANNQHGFRGSPPTDLPQDFLACLDWHWLNGRLDPDLYTYYRTINGGDSSSVPGQGGLPSLLRDVLSADAQTDLGSRSEWKRMGDLGKGGFGSVQLWEKRLANGQPLRIAIKDTEVSTFFRDYCAEAQFTRRINDAGCPNVINVAEWAYIAPRQYLDAAGRSHWRGSKHRICYEYAEHGDLFALLKWYGDRRLILPEAFLWHVLHSMANALLYCSWGRGKEQELGERPGWNPIYHGDIKEQNILMTDIVASQHSLYPCLKLCDFGMAWTLNKNLPEISRKKTAGGPAGDGIGWTKGYDAPELGRQWEQSRRRRRDNELVGIHTDVFALARTIEFLAGLIQAHSPHGSIHEQFFRDHKHGKLSKFYSPTFTNLAQKCLSDVTSDRPQVYDLWYSTEHQVRMSEMVAYTGQREAIKQGHDKDCFRDSVLFSAAQHRRYDTDKVFQTQYRLANLQPLWDLTGFDGKNSVAPPLPPPSSLPRQNQRLGNRAINAQVQQGGAFVCANDLAIRKNLEKKRQDKKARERGVWNENRKSSKRGPTFAGIIKNGVSKMFGWRRR